MLRILIIFTLLTTLPPFAFGATSPPSDSTFSIRRIKKAISWNYELKAARDSIAILKYINAECDTTKEMFSTALTYSIEQGYTKDSLNQVVNAELNLYKIDNRGLKREIRNKGVAKWLWIALAGFGGYFIGSH